jgi:hypothetical protein
MHMPRTSLIATATPVYVIDTRTEFQKVAEYCSPTRSSLKLRNPTQVAGCPTTLCCRLRMMPATKG